jgi:glutathione S-transferase
MALVLYYHPLASYCWKVLIALYESGVEFEREIVDLQDPEKRAEFMKLTPLGKMPVLVDEDAGRGFPEATINIEYLAIKFPEAAKLIPEDRNLALRARLSDRFYDNYVHAPMQKIVLDRLRPADRRDPYGVDMARNDLEQALTLVDRDMKDGGWATGEAFTMADCSAAPALFHADRITPLAGKHLPAARYLDRLKERPSFARVLKEAEPYFGNFPQG